MKAGEKQPQVRPEAWLQEPANRAGRVNVSMSASASRVRGCLDGEGVGVGLSRVGLHQLT